MISDLLENQNKVVPGGGKLNNKAIWRISFLSFNSSNISKTYNGLEIPKLPGFISLQKRLFVKDCFEKEIRKSFIKYFIKSDSRHSYRTHSAFKIRAFVPKVNIEINGEKNPSNTSLLINWTNVRNNSR